MTPGRLPRVGASPRSECKGFSTGVQSHSLSQGYRADLPTSLGRVIFSLEVSSLGDLMRLSVRCPPVTRSPSWGAPRPGARRLSRRILAMVCVSRAGPFHTYAGIRPVRWSGGAGREAMGWAARCRNRAGLRGFWPAALSTFVWPWPNA